jgi:hypothetical protein
MWSTDFTENPEYKISLKSVRHEPNCTRWIDMMSLCADIRRKTPTASLLKDRTDRLCRNVYKQLPTKAA